MTLKALLFGFWFCCRKNLRFDQTLINVITTCEKTQETKAHLEFSLQHRVLYNCNCHFGTNTLTFISGLLQVFSFTKAQAYYVLNQFLV